MREVILFGMTFLILKKIINFFGQNQLVIRIYIIEEEKWTNFTSMKRGFSLFSSILYKEDY